MIGPIWRAGTPPSVRFVWDVLPPRPPGVCLGRGKLALALGAARIVRQAFRLKDSI